MYKKLLDASLTKLMSQANALRQKYEGNKMHLCSIINAKCGACSEDCKYCAQSSHYHTEILSYALKDNEAIFQEARQAKENGAQKFGIVTSGNSLNELELKQVAQVIARIKNELGLGMCASLGAMSEQALAYLKAAGLSRYHHNIETSERFYPYIVSTHKYAERVATVKAAKAVGLEVCSGGIIGLGETWQDRLDMALLLKKLKVDSVPLNILVPLPGTPLEHQEPLSVADILRTICIFRLILRDKTIKIAAGRESALKDFQAMAFMAGANSMMIGGYLTVKGRSVAEDQRLIEEIEKAWSN